MTRLMTRAMTALACAALLVMLAAAAHAQNAFRAGLDAYLEGEYQAALEHWRPAAESGDAVAAFNIGVLYAQGLGVDPDQAEAVRWYRQAAIGGYANAQFNLGTAYYDGEGTEQSISQAVSWWDKAAAQDHPEAAYNLATLYRRGQGVERDPRRAAALFNKAAGLGDTRARQALAEMGAEDRDYSDTAAPSSGEGAAGESPADQSAASHSDPDQSDPDQSDEDQRAAGSGQTGADGGDTASPLRRAGKSLAGENPDHWTVQVFAGTERQAARGFARDHGLGERLRIYPADVDGRTWYKGIYGSFPDRAAAQAAQADLARRLSGSEPWIRSFRAIQAEATGAAFSPTDMPEPAVDQVQGREQSVPAPAPEVVSDSAPTAEEGGGASAEPTGEAPSGGDAAAPSAQPDGDQAALRRGQQAFNARDYPAALEAWRPLAEKGVAEAQYGIGFMYESGWGVEQDYAEAYRWYQQAAQQGHVKAQYNLGMLYRNGQGVSQNEALGLYWIQTAADRGDERAETYLKERH